MMVAPPPPLGRGMPMRRQGMGPKQKGTGVGKGRLGSAGGSGAAFVAPSQEESFQVLSLDQGRPPFAMAIRLTPEVLEDLKRAETEDVKCEMKFGVTPAGHVRISLNVLTVSQSIYGRQFSECSTNAPLLRLLFFLALSFPIPLADIGASASFALFLDAYVCFSFKLSRSKISKHTFFSSSNCIPFLIPLFWFLDITVKPFALGEVKEV